jgi:hypothetical protein
MAADNFRVKLINQGRTMEITIPAYTQAEALQLAEYQYPGYKAMSAQRVRS